MKCMHCYIELDKIYNCYIQLYIELYIMNIY